jgi:hypothetical protein
MIVSRATFLKVCGAVAAGVALSPAADCSEPALHSSARFLAQIGTTFTIDGVSRPVRLTDVSESALHPHIEQFSLLFAGAPGDGIPHGTYTFRHAELGRIDMFITPVGVPGAAPLYQACFSRYLARKDQPCPINS